MRDVRSEIVQEIKDKTHVELMNRTQYEKPQGIDNYEPEILYLYDGGGKRGVLGGIPREYIDKGLNRFFTYISMYKAERYYTINFMMMYIDTNTHVY